MGSVVEYFLPVIVTSVASIIWIAVYPRLGPRAQLWAKRAWFVAFLLFVAAMFAVVALDDTPEPRPNLGNGP